MAGARDEHSLHSPFVFELYTQIIRAGESDASVFADVQRLRRELRRSRQTIEITDFGAGSRVNASRRRAVGDIVRHSEKPARFGRLLYRLVRRFGARTVFDLGTSFGLTTAYLAKAAAGHGGRVVTFEGCPQTAAVASNNFAQLGVRNVDLVVGNLDETLTRQVAAVEQLDLVFFDANHRYEPTLRYFAACLPKAHNNSVFVFDDIHWSAEMEQAWAEIKAHPAVTVTIDLFYVGLVFFRQEQPKQHFTLKFL
ncbi:class I SAM-dependent methyltransferase [Nibrella saemangeumensis]|uniref:Class I SAM-dependent methyltransferase n=2 Tax=Nibrella saemangeumensis TaxID=1084526 RepID=A0ABP8N536_9BACT